MTLEQQAWREAKRVIALTLAVWHGQLSGSERIIEVAKRYEDYHRRKGARQWLRPA